jgi:hypothetical protein
MTYIEWVEQTPLGDPAPIAESAEEEVAAESDADEAPPKRGPGRPRKVST